MVNLNKAHEMDNGLISDGVIVPDSIFEKTRSSKPSYSGDLVISEEFYNSLTQVDANRIAKIDYSYTEDFLDSQTITYYESDGVTVFDTETINYTYTNEDITDIEVT